MKILELFEDVVTYLDTNGHEKTIDFLLQETKEPLTIVCLDEVPTYDEVKAFLTPRLYNNKNLKLVFGGSDVDYYKPLSQEIGVEIETYPDFLFLHTYYFQVDNQKIINPKVDTLYIFMNYRTRLHRKMLIDCLAKEKLLEDNYFTWWNPPFKDGRGATIAKEFSNNSAFSVTDPEYTWKHWRPKKTILLSQTTEPETPPYLTVPVEFKKSLINLIAETTTDVPFITEKTYNSILWKKPFIILGHLGIHQDLVDLGFKLPDFIDYRFDQEPDLEKRVYMIVEELKRLSLLDLEKLKNLAQPFVNYNYDHYGKLVNNASFPDYLRIYMEDKLQNDPKRMQFIEHYKDYMIHPYKKS